MAVPRILSDLAGTLRNALRVGLVTLDASGLSAPRTFALPNKAGTVRVLGADVVNVLTNSGGTVTVDCSLGKDFTLTLAANVTGWNIVNLPGAGYATEIEVVIAQDATGSRTVTLPSSFKALGGSDTTVASAANAVTVLSAKTVDNGTTWSYAMQDRAA